MLFNKLRIRIIGVILVSMMILAGGVVSGQAWAADRYSGSCTDDAFSSDGMLWGTEALLGELGKPGTVDILKNKLCVRYVKVRLQMQMASADGESFTPKICVPSQSNCRFSFDLDQAVSIARGNGLSLFPMLSHDPQAVVTKAQMDSYVNFVDWFITRYRDAGNIQYVELVNNPVLWWKGSKEQLLEVSNRIYDRVKKKYPSLKVGTPGFEYWADAPATDKSIEEAEYFLNGRNGARFDFWAFHGYPAIEISKMQQGTFYPPTKQGVLNKYTGVPGIVEIRRRMDENGWASRLIIDTEHVGLAVPGPHFDDSIDGLDAAYSVQDMVLKRSLSDGKRRLLDGLIAMKIYPRRETGEMRWGSLRSDGSISKTVRAIEVFLKTLSGYRHDRRLSGEFDRDRTVWVEKFSASGGDLFVFFKPFGVEPGSRLKLDPDILTYELKLDRSPISAVIVGADGNESSIAPSKNIRLKAINAPQYLRIVYQ